MREIPKFCMIEGFGIVGRVKQGTDGGGSKRRDRGRNQHLKIAFFLNQEKIHGHEDMKFKSGYPSITSTEPYDQNIFYLLPCVSLQLKKFSQGEKIKFFSVD